MVSAEDAYLSDSGMERPRNVPAAKAFLAMRHEEPA